MAAARRARTPAILVRYSIVPRLSLIGHKLDDETLQRLDGAARGACRPITDKRGTIEYRTKIAGVLARRAAAIAFERAAARA